MVVVDLTNVDEAGSFQPVPNGDYPAQIIEVEEKHTNAGDPMWNLKFEIIGDGEYKGRHFFDNLVFSANPKVRQRLKLALKRLRFDVDKQIKLSPSEFIGRTAVLTVVQGEYADAEGVMRKNNKVPFAGYEYYEPDGSQAPKSNTGEKPIEDDDDLPF